MWSYTSRDGRLTAEARTGRYQITDNRTGAVAWLDTSGPVLKVGDHVAYPRVWFGDFTHEWGSAQLHAAIRRGIERQRADVLRAYFGRE